MAHRCKMVTKCKSKKQAVEMEMAVRNMVRQLSREEQRRWRCQRCGKSVLSEPEGPVQIAVVESKLYEGSLILVCIDEVYPTETWEDPNFDAWPIENLGMK